MGGALHCPDIVPEHAKEAFGSRWYSARQFHSAHEHGVKPVDKLLEDGRLSQYLKAATNLVGYLPRG
tara:strand:+ start:113 stop:313 length:201 start_codon:yes stop_codon:yes gene_type:complete